VTVIEPPAPGVRRFRRFVIVGTVTNLALLGLFAAFIQLGIAATTASVAIYLIGVLVTYLINRTWSFESNRCHVIGGAGYFAVHAGGIATVAALQEVLHECFGVPSQLVQVFAMGLVAATSFALFDRIVFPRQPDALEPVGSALASGDNNALPDRDVGAALDPRRFPGEHAANAPANGIVGKPMVLVDFRRPPANSPEQ